MMANPREDSIFRDQELTDTDIPAPRSSHCNAVSGSGSGLAWSARANRTKSGTRWPAAPSSDALLLDCWIAGCGGSVDRNAKGPQRGCKFQVGRSERQRSSWSSQQAAAWCKFQVSIFEVRGSRVSCVRQHSITIDKYIPRNLFRSATAWICVARRAER